MKDAILYTGTFDPFHLGHFWQLERVYRVHPFKKAIVAVSTYNPKKPFATSWQKRIEIAKLKLSEAELPYEVQVLPIDYVTPETLIAFVNEHLAGYRVIRTVASDKIVEFANDSDFGFNKALLLFHYAVVVRPLVSESEVTESIKRLPPDIRERFSYEIVHVQQEDDISATEIRKDVITAAGKGYITPSQLKYIQSNGLYSKTL